jgi:Phosphoglucose isomerase
MARPIVNSPITKSPERRAPRSRHRHRQHVRDAGAGGRYSYDSSIGLSLMIAIGPERFEEMLSRFRSMDEHFRASSWARSRRRTSSWSCGPGEERELRHDSPTSALVRSYRRIGAVS